jgi:hypothetical protein
LVLLFLVLGVLKLYLVTSSFWVISFLFKYWQA